MTMRRLAILGLVVALSASALWAGRYEQYTEAAAKSEDMKPAAATFFGGDGPEEFVAAGVLGDGRIVAFGNAWGPKFSSPKEPLVMGKGAHRGLKAVKTDRKGRKELPRENPDAAGMIVFYQPGLKAVEKVARFDWGVASLSTGAVSKDGKGLILTGRCTEAFKTVGRHAKVQRGVDEPEAQRRRRFGSYKYDGVEVSGDVFVMRIDVKTAKPEWVVLLKGHRQPGDEIHQDAEGNVYVEIHGVKKISADGKTVTTIWGSGFGGKVGLRAVDPKTGTIYWGGDRNTNTGREPWRQPYLYKIGPDGEKIWTAWAWDAKRVGSDKYRLVSDSAARDGAIAPNGDVLVAGWSDGGNSVFTRQPYDLDKPAKNKGLGMSSWGMKNANSLAYILRLDPKTREQKAWTLWLSYIPDDFSSPKHRNAPNFASIKDIRVLEDESIGIVGGAATGLIQTPHSFWTYPRDGGKFGGQFVTVLGPKLSRIRYSTYLPGCKDLSMAATKKGLVVASRSDGGGGRMGKTPGSKNAAQPTFGGTFDGHLLLITE
ncbi:MAG: hypothetical protein ACLFVY_04600 [Phycisphaerae bacterium]